MLDGNIRWHEDIAKYVKKGLILQIMNERQLSKQNRIKGHHFNEKRNSLKDNEKMCRIKSKYIQLFNRWQW